MYFIISFQMLRKILLVVSLSTIVNEIKLATSINFQLPEEFEDDNSFDKSGFIPELDFSHFFQRVNFDRSLNDFIDTTGLNQEASKNEETIGKKTCHCYLN